MKQHVTYHPVGEELMQQYVVYALNEDGATHAAAQSDRAGLDPAHKQRLLDFLPQFARPVNAPFDQTHGFSIAVTHGFFDTYYYIYRGSLSAISDAVAPYTASWQSVMPAWDATATAENRLASQFSSGVYIPAHQIAPFMNEAHSVPALAAALGTEFAGPKLDVLWAALLRANQLGVGLLEAAGVIEPDPADLMQTQCFTKFDNCEPTSLAHYVALAAALAPPPPKSAEAVTPQDWHTLLSRIAAPYGNQAQLVAMFSEAQASAGGLAALTGSVKALGLGLWFDWKEGHLLEQACRDLADHRIGWSDEDFGRRDELQFTWHGDDAEVHLGLEAFDRWLETRNTGQRLVSVTTQGDFFLSILAPEAEARDVIAALAGVGLSGSLQDGTQPEPAPAPPPPPMTPAQPPAPELLPWERTNDAPPAGTRLPTTTGLSERLRQKREGIDEPPQLPG